MQVLSKPSSRLEPITVMLECGHTTDTIQDAKRARCTECPKHHGVKRLRQVRQRIRQSIARRIFEPGEEAIYVRVETDEQRGRKVLPRRGYRVLQVQVWDVTRERGKGATLPAMVCESLRVCCSAAGVQYVRAKLLEMGEALDGAVIVT